ncbi:MULTISPECIES: DUF2871 domain-containing protein [Bacillus]|uniref:DUF2871 domain-containing protein n=2 Tax=Bacillus cereus group TaxID=86661 RepID=A0A2A7D1F8_BACAN|nr:MULTISPECIES: DUF2871 domain-containing protein [Bacillus]MCP1163194.1 DUF2871 domain-containing protein [Bacillus sp. 1813sda1]MDC7972461.1 DUF2871 domain-containing protein [Bacillus sp. BLCC-B18]OTW65083.1 hypothetical protein BK707_30015 [Bacillus thuringiensis serovar coreanensis]OTX49086.1 hypothetical protein BK724_06275 [Bacillus thuringiensis serovar sooncheon]OTX57737.1 hypothetical protein BK725_08205 [Bacillus thuringiensis serovar guiyangiensis]
MKRLYNAAFIYLIIGLFSGVFAREYTKAQGIKGSTMLQLVHTHVLVLGFVFCLIALALCKVFHVQETKSFRAWFVVYNVGLIFTIATMLWRGLLQVNGTDFNGLSHMAGLGHVIISIGLVWFMILLKKSVK